jgi:NADH:ubiquinone oxidoreductase subunit K
MSSIGLQHYLVLASILFCIGIYGVLAKRNAIVILMCIEIMLNAVNIVLVALSGYLIKDVVLLHGHVFVIFVLVVAAAEATVGLAIIMAIYRSRRSIDPDQIDMMKG